jgi:thiamine-phosphate pyrophosphorylase
VDCAFPRLHVVTDTRPVAGSTPLTVVRAAVAGALFAGAIHQLAVQVRVEDDVTDREAYALTVAVLDICRPAGVLCLVNDRLHIALAAGADGGHVGADDLPVAAAGRILDAGATHRGGPRRAVLGATCRNADDATAAVAAGATYLGAGPAFTTGTKSGLPDPIGPNGIRAVARAVPGIPVLAIGGVVHESAGMLRASGAWGIAVVGALSSARDPQRAAIELLTAVTVSAPPDVAVDADSADLRARASSRHPRSPGERATRLRTTGPGTGA